MLSLHNIHGLIVLSLWLEGLDFELQTKVSELSLYE